jgi:hypothetical protein
MSVSTRSDYPGGRQYLHGAGATAGDVWVWSESSQQSIQVTDLKTSMYLPSSSLWSNDGQDSFISFWLYDYSTNPTTNYLYRAHVSASDIASPTFQRVTHPDPLNRLELVAVGPNVYWYWWNHYPATDARSGYYYVDPIDTTKIRFHNIALGSDQVVYITGGVNLKFIRVVPPVDTMNPDRYIVARGDSKKVTGGLLAIDLATSTQWWLATGLTHLDGNGAFSPDGSMVAYGTEFVDKSRTPYYRVYSVPLAGGTSTLVGQVIGTKQDDTAVEIVMTGWVNQ